MDYEKLFKDLVDFNLVPISIQSWCPYHGIYLAHEHKIILNDRLLHKWANTYPNLPKYALHVFAVLHETAHATMHSCDRGIPLSYDALVREESVADNIALILMEEFTQVPTEIHDIVFGRHYTRWYTPSQTEIDDALAASKENLAYIVKKAA